MRSRPRKGNPVRFDPSPTDERAAGSVVGLRFDLDLRDGRTRVDLVACQPRWLAMLLGEELRSRAIGWRKSTFQRCLRAVLRFFSLVQHQSPELREPSQLRAAHIDAFEVSVFGANSEVGARQMVQAITLLLSGVIETYPALFHADLVERARFVSERRPPPRPTPRDSYSPYVRKQLRLAAREDAWAAIERVASRDKTNWPKMSMRKQLALDQQFSDFGVIVSQYYSFLFQGLDERRQRYVINGAYAFTCEDVAPMIVWVCLETGLEPECCVSLKMGAVEPPKGKVARIKYFKSRRSGGSWQSIPVSDASVRSVPALIRRVAELGGALRAHAGGDGLWLHITPRIVREPRFSVDVAKAVRDWSLRRGILDDDGRPLHLVLSRLRKTHRSVRYQQVEGDLTTFAFNHSKGVAGDNYADIPSHRDLHAGVVADAQVEVVAAARRSAAGVRVEPQSPRGADELWLASCERQPPVGTSSAAVPTPFLGVLRLP